MSNVNSGGPHTGIDKPTHVPGITRGNAVGKYAGMQGHNADGTSTAARSTGVAATEPIDPSMPNISPA
jgi:hypothetical protein